MSVFFHATAPYLSKYKRGGTPAHLHHCIKEAHIITLFLFVYECTYEHRHPSFYRFFIDDDAHDLMRKL